MWTRVVIFCIIIGAVNLTDVTYYEILGVSKKASVQEIRQAYKKLVVKFHPDKNPGVDEQEKFLKITEAYETLKDPDKRHNYDVYGSQTYSRKYDYRSQSEYDNLFYNGLYHNDPFVDTLSGTTFSSYLKDGFYFINFYSPFCPPCQNVADDWKKLAEMYKGIVKIGAVNCKYHNSFCYNNMRISSYPSLLFYPNGKNGNFVYYRGDRTLESLDEFILQFLRSQVHVPRVYQIRTIDRPMAYIMGANRIENNALTRIAYHLNGVIQVVIVDDDDIRKKLASDEYTTVVYRHNNINKEFETTDEKEIVREIVNALPKVDQIGPEKLKDVRNNLRRSSQNTWVLFFSSKETNKLQLYQMKIAFPNMNFGEVDCDKWAQLCSSLHVESPPAWGVLKRGGVYQRAYSLNNIKNFINSAADALNLHTLSASDFIRILDGDTGTWVLLVAPYESSWEHIADSFTRASRHFENRDDMNFGIMACTLNTNKYCRQVAYKHPVILVQNGGKQNIYNGKDYEHQLREYIDMIIDSEDLELKEQQVLEILDASSREHSWLVAYLPPRCGEICDQLAYEWMIVAKKLRPLEFVRVGILNCAHKSDGFCHNIRSPVARLYPIASGHHYSVNLQHLNQAPYILEWALEYIDDSILKLNWQMFTKKVIAEELNPSGKKPWLVYFHSPRCYRCYEMFSDFAIAGIMLNNAVHLGKVNCVNERSLCQHEQVMSYPSLKLYLSRNENQRFSSVINIQVRDYQSMLDEIKPHLMKHDQNLLAGFDNRKNIHDEF